MILACEVSNVEARTRHNTPQRCACRGGDTLRLPYTLCTCGASAELLGNHRGEGCSHLLSDLAGPGSRFPNNSFPNNIYTGGPRDYHLYIQVAWRCQSNDTKTDGKGTWISGVSSTKNGTPRFGSLLGCHAAWKVYRLSANLCRTS